MFNIVVLTGRLTADPELKTTQSGLSVTSFSIAVDRRFGSGEERQTDFINVVAWRNTAEFINRYFSKGKMIIVEGSLRNNNYTDKNGVKHYSMDVQAYNVNFGESKSSGDGGNASAAGYAFADPPKSAVSTANQESAAIGGLEDFEEILSDGEVPF